MTEITALGAWQIAFWYVVFTVGTAVVWVTFGGQHRRMVADRQIAWLCWHWFTGGLLEAARTFPGLDDEAPAAARAARRAGLAAARTTGTLTAGAVWYVNAGARYGTAPLTVLAAGACAAAAVVAVTVLVAHAACELAHYLCWIRPLHLAVHDPLGWDQDKRPTTYLTVPRDRAASDDGVVVGFPPGFDLKSKRCEDISNIVRRKLDLGDVVETWVPAGRHSYVQYRPRDPMPERCFYRDPINRDLVRQAKPSAPVVGVKRGGKPVTIDLDSESPHLLLSAGSGGGKSSTLRTITAQLMAHGALVMVIDIKRHSHPWLRGVEGVHYARDIEDIHDVLVRVAAEGEKRNRAWDEVGIDEPGPTFPRLVLLCEEMTATMGKLTRWWKANREPGDPNVSPAVDALQDIACMGRQVRIHIIAIAQMATAKSIGGSEIRENFAFRVLGRYTKRAWEMLVPECEYTPAAREPGRMQVCIGGTATETQMLFMTDHEARALASGDATATRLSPGNRPVDATPVASVEAGPVNPLVSLREAIESGLVPLSLSAIRSARARDPEFPAAAGKDGQTDLYEPAVIARWARNRPLAPISTDV